MYLLEHPLATDTLDGIQLWWLQDSRQLIRPALRKVLEDLVGREWLLGRGKTPETRVYALNPDETEAVRAFVKAQSDRESSGPGGWLG